MKVTYRIGEEDYVGARDLFVAHERPYLRRLSRRLMPWMGGALLLMQVAYILIVPDWSPVLLVCGFSVGAYFLYCGFAIRRYFRRSYRKDRRFQHDFVADISEAGIHLVTPTAESQ